MEGQRESASEPTKGDSGRSFLDGGAEPRDPASDEAALRFIHRFGPRDAPVDMASSGGSEHDEERSALSSPQNFIAESGLNRALNRLMGRRRWPIAACGALVAAALLGGTVASGRFSQATVSPNATMVDTDAKAAQPIVGLQPSPAATPGAASPVDTAADLKRRLEQSAPSGSSAGPMGLETRMSGFPLNVPPLASDKPEPVDDAETADAGDPSDVTGTVTTEPPAALPRPEDTQKRDALIARGQQLLDSGEVAAARLFFERAAAEGDPRGALGVAKSYNERVLKTLPVVGLQGNSAEAERWYRKAAELESRQRARGNP